MPAEPVHVAYERSDGTPLGKKQLGAAACKWLAAGAASAARVIIADFEQRATAQRRADDADNDESARTSARAGMVAPAGESVYALLQRYLEGERVPAGAEDACARARASLPTLTEALNTALLSAVRDRAAERGDEDGRGADGEATLQAIRKAMRSSSEHRTFATGIAEERKVIEARRLVAEAVAARCDELVELNSLERGAQEAELELDLAATVCRVDRRDFAGEPTLVRAASVRKSEGRCVLTLCFPEGTFSDGTEDTADASVLEGASAVRPVLRNGSSIRLRVLGEFEDVAARNAGVLRGEAAMAAAEGKLVLSGRATRATSDLVDVTLDEDSSAPAAALGGEEALFSTGFAMFVGPDVRTFERNAEYIQTLKGFSKAKRLRQHHARDVVLAAFGEVGSLPAPAGATGSAAAGSDGVSAAVESRATEAIKKAVGATQLNPEQSLALESALDPNRPVTVIQGPPGTGKSQVLEAVVRAAVDRGQRVLVCAPSNAAVDNMVERLARAPAAQATAGIIDIVRSGNPERVTAAAQSCLLAARAVEAAEVPRRAKLAQLAEIRRLLEAKRWEKSELMDLTTRQRKLRRQVKALARDTARRLASNADVVCCTCTGLGEDAVISAAPFDLVVLDEAAQATEPSSWGPLLAGKRAVLAGDVHQLGPTVISPDAGERGLSTTLMDRLSSAYGGALTVTLKEQYRMHSAISQWAADATYGGELRAAEGVAQWLLADLPGVQATAATQSPIALIDTTGQVGAEERHADGGGSLYNLGEAFAVETHVRDLLAAGVTPASIAVVSPYAAQVALLKNALSELEVEVATVDGWQGREADAVVLSMVRSNEYHTVGFLADERRLNVAATRARMHLAIVCDVSTVGEDPFIAGLLRACRLSGVQMRATLTAGDPVDAA